MYISFKLRAFKVKQQI